MSTKALTKEEKKEQELLKKEVKKREKLKKHAIGLDRYYVKSEEPSKGDVKKKKKKGEQVVAKPAKKEKVVIVADYIEQLPEDCKKTVQTMNQPRERLEQNFDILLRCFNIADKLKRQFKTSANANRPEERREEYPVSPIVNPLDSLAPYCRMKEATKLFKISTCLGEGGFGEVFEAKYGGADPAVPKRIALKIMPCSSDRERKSNAEELSFLKYSSDCEYVCRMYHAFRVIDEIWLSMEVMVGGNLKQASNTEPFTEGHIAYVGRDLLKGINFLHERRIAHRDLKNLNVMMNIEGVCRIKIIDFGLAADMSQGPRKQGVGSPYWMAPEIVKGEWHDTPVDIWSFQVCMLELANSNPPNVDNLHRCLFVAAVTGYENSGLVGSKWTSTFRDFLARCQYIDQAKRATAKELLAHDFIKKACSEAEMRQKLTQIFTVVSLARSQLI